MDIDRDQAAEMGNDLNSAFDTVKVFINDSDNLRISPKELEALKSLYDEVASLAIKWGTDTGYYTENKESLPYPFFRQIESTNKIQAEKIKKVLRIYDGYLDENGDHLDTIFHINLGIKFGMGLKEIADIFTLSDFEAMEKYLNMENEKLMKKIEDTDEQSLRWKEVRVKQLNTNNKDLSLIKELKDIKKASY